jgi:hypothetical protein
MAPRLPRRRFLQLAGGAAVLAACGDGGRPGSAPLTALDDPQGSVPVTLFSTDRVIAAGSRQRLPFAVFTAARVPRRDDALPAELVVGIADQQGTAVGTERVALHGRDLVFPYYPLRATLPQPGLYELGFELDDGPGRLVVQAFDPAEVRVVQPGQVMPAVATPTVADPRGVDPLCTRFEPCPFHAVSFDEVRGSAPVALLVATPAYCQTGVCGPVLDRLIAAAGDHPAVTFIHAEVFANPREVGGNLADPALRPAAVTAELGLSFEPSLFLVAGDGTLVDRLDNVYDDAELAAGLAALA